MYQDMMMRCQAGGWPLFCLLHFGPSGFFIRVSRNIKTTHSNASSRKRRSGNRNSSLGPWDAIERIGVRAIDRAQVIPVGLTAIVIVIFYRLPAEEIGPIVEKTLNGLADFQLLGWALFVLTIIGWSLNVRFLRSISWREHDRIGREKTKVQELLAEKKLGTSQKQ